MVPHPAAAHLTILKQKRRKVTTEGRTRARYHKNPAGGVVLFLPASSASRPEYDKSENDVIFPEHVSGTLAPDIGTLLKNAVFRPILNTSIHHYSSLHPNIHQNTPYSVSFCSVVVLELTNVRRFVSVLTKSFTNQGRLHGRH